MARSTAQSAVWALARRQHAVVSREQLRTLGFSDEAIDHRVERGRLHPVRRGVFAVGRPDLDDRGRWMAAVLACGDGAALSHESAATLWGLIRPGRGRAARIHVSVPAGRHPRQDGIHPHRRTNMPPTTFHSDIPLTQPLFTLIDLATTWKTAALEEVVNEADKLNLLRFDDARAQLDTITGVPGVAKLRRTLDRHSRTDSNLERRFLAIVRKAGLQKPRTQATVNGFRVDFYWPDLRLVVETDGLTYHRTPAQQAEDRRRDQIHTAAGLTCLRFTNAQVRRQASLVSATLAAVAARRG